MGDLYQFPDGVRQRTDLERVRSTYTAHEISRRFGLSEQVVRRWAREGLIGRAAGEETGELRFDFQALNQLRRVRELRNQGLSVKQIEAELRGQLNLFSQLDLFPEAGNRVVPLPVRLSPFEEALALHERGDPRAAQSYLQTIERGEYTPDAYCSLGIMEFDKGNLVEAFECFTRALGHDPRHFESHLNLGHLYFECGDLRLARLHYELAARIEPSFPDLYFNLGLVHAVRGEFEDAVDVLRKAKEFGEEDDGRKVDVLLKGIAELLRNSAGNPGSS